MFFAPRKKIITSRFSQRGNIVSLLPPPDPGPPEIDTFAVSQFKDFSLVPNIDLLVGVWVSADGGKLVVADRNVISPDEWIQYSLTTPFDLATLTLQESDQNYTTPNRISGVFLTEDGLQMRSVSRSPTNAFIRNTVLADFAPPFDISSVGQQSAFNIGVSAFGIHFSPDGLKLYTVSNSTLVREHTLTSAFDPATATLINTFETNAETTLVEGITFSINGFRMFVADSPSAVVPGIIFQYDLSTAFDISTAVYSNKSISSVGFAPSGLHMVLDSILFVSYPGLSDEISVRKFLIAGGVGPLPPPPPPAGNANDYYLRLISNGNPGFSSGTRLDVFWRQDGLKVWTARQAGTIRQYSVSPAWGILVGDWTFEFTTAAIGNLRSVWWSPDGTVFAHCQRVPATSVRVTTFDQSATPWDITVLGASTTLAWTPTGGATPLDIIFSPDGKRLWMSAPIGGTAPILEFALTVGYDMTTLNPVQVKSFNLASNNTLAFSGDGTKLFLMVAQRLDSYDMSIPFDIDTLSNFQVGPIVPAFRVTIPRGLNFREDNEDIFVHGDQNQRRAAIFSRTNGPNLDDLVFSGAIDTSGGNRLSYEDMWVGPDGLNLYTCRGSIAVSDIFQFAMSPAHDISSLTFVKEDDADGQSPRGIALSESGDALMIYYRNAVNPDAVFRWPTPAPFDIAHNGPRTSLAADFSNAPQGLWFKPDGTEVYLIDNIDQTIYQYNLPTPFEWTGATQTNTFDYSVNTTSSSSLTFSSDGKRMYLVNNTMQTIDQYDLQIAFDVSTAFFGVLGGDPGQRLSLPGGPGGSNARGLAIRDNFLYVCYQDNQFIEQFTLVPPAPTITDFVPASYKDISGTTADSNGIWVDVSGVEVMVSSDTPDADIHSFTMTAFDVTTLSGLVAQKPISSRPIGVFMKPDGTKLFATSFSSSVGIHEYTLGTPFDITTAGGLTLLSTAGDGATIPFGLHFSPDGLNVYCSDNGGNVYQWSLASAWDLSSPTFIGSFDFTSEIVATKAQDITLSEDGTKMYLPDLNAGTDSEIFQYSLATPFNLTTAVYDSVMLTLTGRIGAGGLHLMSSQDRFYVAYNGDAGGADPEAIEEFIIP